MASRTSRSVPRRRGRWRRLRNDLRDHGYGSGAHGLLGERDGRRGLSIAGNGSWYIGANIDGVGDFDGDGSDDLGVGVIQANANGNLSGAAFLVGGGRRGPSRSTMRTSG